LRLQKHLLKGDICTPEDLAPLLHNDFEAVVLPALEPLRRLRACLEAWGALRVLLCGSGAAQAALCRSQSEAETVAQTLRAEGYWAEAAQMLLVEPSAPSRGILSST
jgi:4-diphosphocytidyl-2C-methyl-D-erythritol kinase